MNSLIDRLSVSPTGQPVLSDGTHQLDGPATVAAAFALAAWLYEREVKRLALRADNSVTWVLCDLACQLVQLPFLPLPSYFSAEQCEHALREGGVDAVLSSMPDGLPEAYRREAVKPCSGLTLFRSPLGAVPELPPGTGTLTFTSGSTGTPKGVCLSNAQLLRQAQVLADAVGLRAPRHLCVLPLSTLLEIVAGVYAPLLAGGVVHLRTLEELGMAGSRMADPQRFLSVLSEVQPDTLILTPQLLQLLVHSVEAGWRPPRLRFIAVGGSRVSAALIQKARAAGLPVFEGYGLSECASVVSLNTSIHDLPGSCGRPLPHVQVSVENREVVIAGNAMLGYVNDPASWGGDVIRSGDLGYLDAEGFLHIEGRRTNLLISSYGRNIAPEWVESELLATGAFREAVVFGDAQPWCVALVSAARPGLDVAAMQDAIDAANARLPDYARVQRWQCLPQTLSSQGLCTVNGRPRRAEIEQVHAATLRAMYEEQATQVASPVSASAPSSGEGREQEKLFSPRPGPSTLGQDGGIRRSSEVQFYPTLVERTAAGRRYLLSAPIIARCFSGDITLDDYVAFLLQAYHHVKHTVPLLMGVGARLPESKEWLRSAVAEYISEETGHQEWVLNDIAACGYDKEGARRSQPHLTTELMVAYAWDLVNRVDALGFFGMVHVLEGTSISIASQAADVIKTKLALPQQAFSYLYSHGSLDQEHIKFFEDLMNRIDDPAEQERIVHSANVFYQLYGNIFRGLDSGHGLPQREALRHAS